MRRNIKPLVVAEALIVLTYFIDFVFFINLQVAVLSSFLVIVASAYTHKKMVRSHIQNGVYVDDRDPLEKIDDPHGLFEDNEINEAPFEELDLKAIIQEEKKRTKTFSIMNLKQGVQGSFSLVRLGGYLFLVLGFIALKNNELLSIAIYLPSLAVGVVLGYFAIKEEV